MLHSPDGAYLQSVLAPVGIENLICIYAEIAERIHTDQDVSNICLAMSERSAGSSVGLCAHINLPVLKSNFEIIIDRLIADL